MKQYKELVQRILTEGVKKLDRTGTGTIGVFGHQSRYDLREGFPLLGLKQTSFKNISYELLWFLKGDTNIQYLVQNGVNIWVDDAYKKYTTDYMKENPPFDSPYPHFLKREEFIDAIKNDNKFAAQYGSLGNVYGKQWRSWETEKREFGSVTMDQLQLAINTIKNNPMSRRNIVTAWNPGEIEGMTLPPCHCIFQFECQEIPTEDRYNIYYNHVENHPAFHTMDADEVAQKLDYVGVPKHYLSCHLFQRSCDTFLGVPYNIASYALLTEMVASLTNTIAKDFVHTYSDTHLYLNHVEQAKEMITREDLPLPKLKLNHMVNSIDEFKYSDFTIENYTSHAPIKAKLSV